MIRRACEWIEALGLVLALAWWARRPPPVSRDVEDEFYAAFGRAFLKGTPAGGLPQFPAAKQYHSATYPPHHGPRQ